jgi:hypothetical protein
MSGFRRLNPDEIEVRVAQVSKTDSIALLLYKDARVDQKILDETFGMFGWAKRYERDSKGNLFCIVSIKSPDGEWVEKSDVGTESNMESQKGEASDAFKRACFNWGIGRELYTAPTIWINPKDYKKGGKSTYDKFVVSDIGYDAKGNIVKLSIDNKSLGRRVFTWSDGEVEATPDDEVEAIAKQTISANKVVALLKRMESDGISETKLLKLYGLKALEDMTEGMLSEIVNSWSTEIMSKCKQ